MALTSSLYDFYQRLSASPYFGPSLAATVFCFDRESGYCAYPPASHHSLPSPSPHSSAQPWIVKLSGDLIKSSFYINGCYLYAVSTQQLVSSVVDHLSDLWSVDGRAYVRADDSLVLSAASAEELFEAVRALPSLGFEWDSYFKFDADEEPKPLDAGSLRSEVELRCNYLVDPIAGLGAPVSAFAQYPADRGSPFSSSSSTSGPPFSPPSSATASPAYPLAALAPHDMAIPSYGKRARDDSDFDLVDQSVAVPFPKRRAISSLSDGILASTVGYHFEQDAGQFYTAAPLQVVDIPRHPTPDPEEQPRPRKRKSGGRKASGRASRAPRTRFECKYCFANFTRQQDLQRHIDASCSRRPEEVENNGPPRIVCDKCGEALSRKDAYKRHMDNNSCFKSRRRGGRPKLQASPSSL